MMPMSMSRHASIDSETLNDLLDPAWFVKTKPDGFHGKSVMMNGSCASKRDDPARSSIGLRVVPGNASGEQRYCTNRPVRNADIDALADETGPGGDTEIYVPIQWVVAALDADSMEELTEDSL
jgi:hypothetical protein